MSSMIRDLIRVTLTMYIDVYICTRCMVGTCGILSTFWMMVQPMSSMIRDLIRVTLTIYIDVY